MVGAVNARLIRLIANDTASLHNSGSRASTGRDEDVIQTPVLLQPGELGGVGVVSAPGEPFRPSVADREGVLVVNTLITLLVWFLLRLHPNIVTLHLIGVTLLFH